MAGSKRFSPIRGRIMRLTRVDNCGRVVYGEESQVVSKGWVTASFTANVEAGEAIVIPNANGENIINEPGRTQHGGYGVELSFVQVDAALFALATNQSVIYDAQDGQAIGFSVNTEVSPDDAAFALEIWTGVPQVECSDAGEGTYGYLLLPFLRGMTLGDFTIENGAVTFVLTGGTTRNGSAWGVGPYDVMLDALGVAGPLNGNAIVVTGDHLKLLLVEVAPPTDSAGAYPLLDPTDSEVTAFTPTAGTLANDVDFTVTPAGAEEPVLWTFGDGTWDYVVGGDTSHSYEAAGSYEVTAQRGGSSVTQTVVVPVV